MYVEVKASQTVSFLRHSGYVCNETICTN